MNGQDLDLDADWDGEETFGRLESLAGVEAKKVEWLWPGRIAAGCLTLVAGDEGVGKSKVMLDLAARVSRGGKWPDGQGDGIAGGVLLITAENNREYSVLPMLEAAGADLDNVRLWSETLTRRKSKLANVRVTSSRPVNLATDLEVLDRMIEQTPDCRLVVIDPIASFLGKNSSELMKSLMALAERMRVAIVGVTHLKGGGQEARHRVVGGQALTTAARAIWALARESRKEKGESRGERRLFLPIKNNLVQERTGLGFEFVGCEGETRARVEWSSVAIETTADMALQRLRPGPDPIECEQAEEFLRAALAGGGRPVKEVEEEGREVHGIRLDTLRRARKNLQVEAYRETIPGAWWIRLGNAEGEKLSVVGCQLSGADEQESGDGGQPSTDSASSFQARSGQGRQESRAEEGDEKRDWQVGNLPHVKELPDLQCLGEITGHLQELQREGNRELATAQCDIRTSPGSGERRNGASQSPLMSWKQRKKMKMKMRKIH